MTTPLIDLNSLYSVNKNISKLQFLRDPAVITDYNLNLAHELQSQLWKLYGKYSVGLIVNEGLVPSVQSNQLTLSAGIFNYMSFHLYYKGQTISVVGTLGQVNTLNCYLVLTERLFTSDDSPNSDYGSINPPADLVLSAGKVKYDTHNEYRVNVNVVVTPAELSDTVIDGISTYVYKLGEIISNTDNSITLSEFKDLTLSGVTLSELISNDFQNSVAFKDRNNIFTGVNTFKFSSNKLTVV